MVAVHRVGAEGAGPHGRQWGGCREGRRLRVTRYPEARAGGAGPNPGGPPARPTWLRRCSSGPRNPSSPGSDNKPTLRRHPLASPAQLRSSAPDLQKLTWNRTAGARVARDPLL